MKVVGICWNVFVQVAQGDASAWKLIRSAHTQIYVCCIYIYKTHTPTYIYICTLWRTIAFITADGQTQWKGATKTYVKAHAWSWMYCISSLRDWNGLIKLPCTHVDVEIFARVSLWTQPHWSSLRRPRGWDTKGIDWMVTLIMVRCRTWYAWKFWLYGAKSSRTCGTCTCFLYIFVLLQWKSKNLTL